MVDRANQELKSQVHPCALRLGGCIARRSHRDGIWRKPATIARPGMTAVWVKAIVGAAWRAGTAGDHEAAAVPEIPCGCVAWVIAGALSIGSARLAGSEGGRAI